MFGRWLGCGVNRCELLDFVVFLGVFLFFCLRV